jgi:hypothetical protein
MALRGKGENHGVMSKSVSGLGLALLALALFAVTFPASEARADAPRPFVVADLSDHTSAGVSFTYGQSKCEGCVVQGQTQVTLTSKVTNLFADVSVRPGLKLWASLPIAHRSGTANPNLYSDSHTAFGQLTLGLRQMWSTTRGIEPTWRPRLSAGVSFSGTPRAGAGGEAGLTLRAAKLVSGLHPSVFDVATTTTRLHGELAITRGPAMAQLGLALLARGPDEREIRGELAFEAMIGARIGKYVAVLAETTGSVVDLPVKCQSTCPDSEIGLTELLSGNLGVRVSVPYAELGARLIVPLTNRPTTYTGGGRYPREDVSLSFSVDASARF